MNDSPRTPSRSFRRTFLSTLVPLLVLHIVTALVATLFAVTSLHAQDQALYGIANDGKARV